eukprot:TRINITY_DN10459_c0_g1_i1.p1 TRINITY_DN10459_c0_g1~~TRINITY_DN10459_c0_g1_i1.p1  ORF type:complete len:240 (-),score=47.29 TRINITY_DN10459_c0_g1_i1:67-786(-)
MSVAPSNDLKERQEKILNKLNELEKKIISHEEAIPDYCYVEESEPILRVKNACKKLSLKSSRFKRVAADYYSWDLEQRRVALGAHSTEQLCKTILLENGRCTVNNCDNINNSKYYAVIIQYTTRLNAQKIFHYVRGLNNYTISKKKFKFRLAPTDIAKKLTGFEFNGTCPIGMNTDIPIILSDAILKLNPPFFWFGGGEFDVKVGCDVQEFISATKCLVTDVIHDGVVGDDVEQGGENA